jgi:hypothetical protein
VTTGGEVAVLLNGFQIHPTGPPPLKVEFDIKPQGCPNPFNTKSEGVLPAAILGTGDFDVNDVDPTSLLLEGVASIRNSIEDVSGPVEPGSDVCDCTSDGADGFMDMVLKFDPREILEALEPVLDGEIRVLTLTGMTYAGIPIQGQDCVIAKRKGGPGPAVEDRSDLGENYPNPANPETNVSFTLRESVHTTLTIYNVLGKATKVLVDQEMSSGTHTVRWDGRDELGNLVSSGVYFYRLEAGTFNQTRKMLLMK